jgi:flagellar basal-body rod protein FlgB
MKPTSFVDEPLLRQLERALDVMSQRQQLVASNIANVDTPHYRTVDIDFDKALSRALDGSSDRLTAKRTQIGHMASHAEPGAPVAREVQGLPVRNDGNNVSLEREMMALRSIRGKYKVAATVARKRFDQIKSALSEGR